jgi:4-hydroxybenzoate polyprenyltransferase
MVLNDVYDLEIDRRQRPERPLPSGRVDPALARMLGYELLLAGVAFGWLAGWLAGTAASGIVATALATMVVIYDAWLKRTPLGPVGMGTCRLLNVLLGMSAAMGMSATVDPLSAVPTVPLAATHWLIAVGIGTYVIGVTWFARSESTTSPRGPLALAIVVMIAGLALLAWFPAWAEVAAVDFPQPRFADGPHWMLLLVTLGFMILWRPARAVIEPVPSRVQTAVKQCILSLIVLDAAVTYAFHGMSWSVAILLLLFPALTLGRWFAST